MGPSQLSLQTDFKIPTPSQNVSRRVLFKFPWFTVLDLVGAAQGLNQAAQCLGAILIAPLIKRWPVRTVLAMAVIFFGLMTMILLVVDASTGTSHYNSANSVLSLNATQVVNSDSKHLMARSSTVIGIRMPYATISRLMCFSSLIPSQIFVIWTLAGVAYGMVELIRRVM